MTPVEIGILGIIVLVILLLLRVPAGISLIIVAALGNSLLTAPVLALEQLGADVVRITQTQALGAIPFFTLMGIFLTKAGAGSALFELLNSLLCRRKGGMAISALGASSIFSAVCGRGISGPTQELDAGKDRYDEGFAVAASTAGAAMGMVASPVVVLVIYGFLTGESISQVILAGIVPLILAAALLALSVPVILALKPKFAPVPNKGKPPFPKQALKVAWVVPVIFLVVFGGIFMDWVTVTEAGALGAFVTFVFACAVKRMSKKFFVEAVTESVKTLGNIFVMIIGGSLFWSFLSRSLITLTLTNFTQTLDAAPILVVLFFLIVYVMLGLIMNKLATLVIMTPIAYPVIISLGFSGVWFGAMTALMLMSAYLVRPISNSDWLSFNHSMPNVRTSKIFTAQLPFLVTMLIVCVLMAIVPFLATLLPRMMLGW
ncbi:MAG: TRAP transporter large permease subunit [Oscillospiraceae bacterium]|nr:TRAP transporter large permease subunit [Oscillospiraceae bacterium]